MRSLAGCEMLAVPVALAGDAGALVVIDRVDDLRTVVARSDPLSGDAQVRAAYDLAVAVESLHAAGQGHLGIGEWTVDVAADGSARLRGAAESSELDRTGARRDICAVASVIERIGDGHVDARIRETVTALNAGRAGLAAMIACTAGVLALPVSPTRVDGVARPRRLVGDMGLTARRQRTLRQRAGRPDGSSYVPRHAAAPARLDRRLFAAVVTIVLGALLAVAAFWPRDHAPLASVASRAWGSQDQVREPTWSSYLPALYDTRAEAFTSGDVDLLAQVFTTGSAQLRADVETIEALTSQKRTVKGFSPTVIEVVSIDVSGEIATAVVRDEIKPFEIVDSSGTSMPVDGRAASTSTLMLHRVDGVWLIDSAQRS